MAMTENRLLIDMLMAEQQTLAAVEQFSRRHDRHAFVPGTNQYRDLIPLTAPQPGQQYGFEVELDQCTGCKACVTACHNLNGLDEQETWRDIGTLVGGPGEAFQQTVTTACHHCIDPACLNGCPVNAYDKDADTGIVRHLDDQCIGCQYCVLKCPYDVPKYNARLGIVRKCDLCSGRLAAGEAPACAQACPNEAIRITVVNQDELTLGFRARGEAFLPGAPEPSYTLPTTRWISSQPLSKNLSGADAHELKPQPPHWPLVFMLLFSQLAAGASLIPVFLGQFASHSMLRTDAALSFGFGLFGMCAGVFHLGRPLGAWRFFLGLRKSWLSREILAFAVFVGLSAVALQWNTRVLATGTALAGLVAVFCSAMVYHDTRRPFWNMRLSATKFFGTTILFGLAVFHVSSTWFSMDAPANHFVTGALILASTGK